MQAVPGSEETFLDFTVFFLNNQETQNSMYRVMCVCVFTCITVDIYIYMI